MHSAVVFFFFFSPASRVLRSEITSGAHFEPVQLYGDFGASDFGLLV